MRRNSFPFFTRHAIPRLFAHRGASGHRPENTLPAFALALEMGAPYLEMDVRMTLDGRVVVLHDETVDRTTDGSGPVTEFTFRELQGLDAGFRFSLSGLEGFPDRGRGVRVPTLEDVLRSFPGAMLNIEVKQEEPAMEGPLQDVLNRCDALDRVLLVSEREVVLNRLRERFGPGVATGTALEEGARFAQWILGGRTGDPRLGGAALQIPEMLAGQDYVVPELIDGAHGLGMEVHIWTVNDPSRMRRFLQMGADGIMTDFPDRFPGT